MNPEKIDLNANCTLSFVMYYISISNELFSEVVISSFLLMRRFFFPSWCYWFLLIKPSWECLVAGGLSLLFVYIYIEIVFFLLCCRFPQLFESLAKMSSNDQYFANDLVAGENGWDSLNPWLYDKMTFFCSSCCLCLW